MVFAFSVDCTLPPVFEKEAAQKSRFDLRLSLSLRLSVVQTFVHTVAYPQPLHELAVAYTLYIDPSISFTTLLPSALKDATDLWMSNTILRSLVSQPPNSNVSRCVSLLQSCASNGAVNRGQQAHSWIIVNGLQQIPFLVTSLINMYSKCHQPWEAVKVFRHTIEPNVFAWNALIAGLVHGHYFSDAVGFYHEMIASHVRGDKFTYPCVLKACTNLQDSWEGKK
ncbi:Pentatricopeptide repeat-containing protein, partial [Nymphaea thermarum]